MNQLLQYILQIKDIHGNFLFTWENLILWAICSVTIFVSLQIKLFLIRLPSRKRNKNLSKVFNAVRNATYQESLTAELHKNKVC